MDDVDLAIEAGTVITMDPDRSVLVPGHVLVTDGRLAAVEAGPLPAGHGARRVVDARHQVVLPGLVNCHTHTFQALHRGLFDEMTLAAWLDEALWPTVRTMDEELAYAGARLALAELALGGVTTTAAGEFSQPDHHVIDGVLRAFVESGLRGVVSRMAIDSDDPSNPAQFIPADLRDTVPDALREVRRLRDRWVSDRLEIVPEALGVLRCSDTMVRELGALARDEDCSFFLHLASSAGEVASCRHRHGVGCVEYLDRLDLLDDRLLLAHVVWPSDEEIALLAGSGARVAHNPVANLSYAIGIAPLMEMLDAGVVVGLGVDGAATNNSQNLWETMKMAMYLQKHRAQDATVGSAELALELATLGGARALGLEDRIGSLEAGKDADLICVDPRTPHLSPATTLTSNLVYSGSPSAVTTVIAGGQLVVDDGQLRSWPVTEVVSASWEAAEASMARAGLTSMPEARSGWRWRRESPVMPTTGRFP